MTGLGSRVLVSALVSAAPALERGMGLPRDASLDGHRIDSLIRVTTGLTGILFAITVVWIFWSALRHNAKNHEAVHDHGDSPRSKLLVFGMAAAVFLVVDGNLFLHSTTDLATVYHDFARVERDPAALRIEVNAHQWAWDTRYAGPDGAFDTADDIVSLNDVRIPVDTPILLEVASTDVVHAFSLPNFRTQVDAVPGTVNHVWFQATTLGEYEIGCAQHCGTHHYKMLGTLTVLSREDFERWAEQASKDSAKVHEVDFTARAESADRRWGWAWKGIGR